jgi:hypothetical protein
VRGNPLRTLLIALIAAIAAILWFRWQAGAPAQPAPAGAPGPAGEAPTRGPTVEPVVPGSPKAPEGSGSEPAPESDPGDLASAWESVDLDEIRRAMPENTFWRMSAPTQDERVIREREEERARWNAEYGKVLSGNASEAEIRAYYAHRQRLSADYVEFTSYVLDHHGDDLSDQDIGLFELARRLHLARLAEYPKQTQEAFERKAKQDEARAAWLADEAEFGAMAPPQ